MPAPGRSHPANPSDHRRHPTAVPVPIPGHPLPLRQMAKPAHFISASYSRPGMPKEMKTMRYSGHPLPMLVASLNSHLYYLSASKSARASPEPLYSPPFFLPAANVSRPHHQRRDAPRARVPLDAYKEVASLPVRNASGRTKPPRRRCWLNEHFFLRPWRLIARPVISAKFYGRR